MSFFTNPRTTKDSLRLFKSPFYDRKKLDFYDLKVQNRKLSFVQLNKAYVFQFNLQRCNLSRLVTDRILR